MRSSRSIRVSLGLIGLALLNATASAYIPPARFILHMIAKKHVGFKTVRVRSRVSAVADGRRTDIHFIATTVFDPVNGLIEITASDDAGQKLFSLEKREFSAADSLLFDTNSSRISTELEKLGIVVPDPATSRLESKLEEGTAPEKANTETLARWGSTIAWVMGNARAPSEPQLWVEKDTFVPIRLVTNSDGGWGELRFEQYRSYRDFLYPHLLIALNRGVATLQDEALDVITNVTPLNGIAASKEGRFTEAGNGASRALQNLINEYYVRVR